MLRRHGIRSALAFCVAFALALTPVFSGTAAAKVVKPKPFRTCGDWVRYARAQSLEIAQPTGIAESPAPPSTTTEFSQPGAAVGGDGSGGERNSAPVAGQDFSTTNVQEQGVDEPDHVKTDGRFAYVFDGGHLRSFDVSAGAPRLLDTLEIDAYGGELLLHGNRLLVMSEPGEDAPENIGTELREVDVSDPAALRVTRIMQVEGWLLDGRMTGSTVRVIVYTEPELDYPEPPPDDEEPPSPDEAQAGVERTIQRAKISTWRPAYKLINRRTGKRAWRSLVQCNAVRKPAEFAGVGTVTVLTIDLHRGLPAVDADALFADADTVYASTDSLYLAIERWDESENPAIASATTIHKFAAPARPETSYRATGAVDGYLYSQWALSEHDGVLRAATTTEPPWESEEPDEGTESHVFTLKENGAGELTQLGRVGGLGKNEVVYAVRFIGETGYVVTFRQVDPLYTIDLSNPNRPRVAGELKIPGYSAYLHPVGEGQLLGVGQDADERGRTRGTALQLFDVSDPARPRLLQKHTLEGDNFSEVEWDHRGFLYWPPTKTAVIPVEAWDDVNDDYGFQGAIGYRVDAEQGIAPIGQIEHSGDEEAGWLTRTFVVGPTLYSVSDAGLGANSLATFGPIDFVPFDG